MVEYVDTITRGRLRQEFDSLITHIINEVVG